MGYYGNILSERNIWQRELTLNLSIYIFGQTFPDGFLGLGLSQSDTKQTLVFMKYPSYERLFFPVIEVMFLVNLDLVKQNKSLQQAELAATV